MKNNVVKIAALARIGADENQLKRLEKDVPTILAMADTLRDSGDAMYAPRPQTLDDLREDVPARGAPVDLSAISKQEKDGFVCVVRTVGESC